MLLTSLLARGGKRTFVSIGINAQQKDKKRMTKDERNHYGRIADLGCVVCLLAGYEHSPCEIHHIRTGTGAGQKSHWSKAIGLCPTHHRLGGYRVAIHSGIEGFEDAIGMSEVELLAKQFDLLNGVTE